MSQTTPVSCWEGAPGKSTVEHWYREFQRGRTNIEDDLREGRPTQTVIPVDIDDVHNLVKKDRHITYREVGVTLGNNILDRPIRLH